jgi:hypothetical protein
MKQKINEIKRMQRLANIIKEDREINTLEALKNVLDEIVKEYVEETEIVAGDDLQWDPSGTNQGIDKNELLKDFTEYINDTYLS